MFWYLYCSIMIFQLEPLKYNNYTTLKKIFFNILCEKSPIWLVATVLDSTVLDYYPVQNIIHCFLLYYLTQTQKSIWQILEQEKIGSGICLGIPLLQHKRRVHPQEFSLLTGAVAALTRELIDLLNKWEVKKCILENKKRYFSDHNWTKSKNK